MTSPLLPAALLYRCVRLSLPRPSSSHARLLSTLCSTRHTSVRGRALSPFPPHSRGGPPVVRSRRVSYANPHADDPTAGQRWMDMPAAQRRSAEGSIADVAPLLRQLRCRRCAVPLTFVVGGREVPVAVPVDFSLLMACEDAEIRELEGACGGGLACSTCHLILPRDRQHSGAAPRRTSAPPRRSRLIVSRCPQCICSWSHPVTRSSTYWTRRLESQTRPPRPSLVTLRRFLLRVAFSYASPLCSSATARCGQLSPRLSGVR